MSKHDDARQFSDDIRGIAAEGQAFIGLMDFMFEWVLDKSLKPRHYWQIHMFYTRERLTLAGVPQNPMTYSRAITQFMVGDETKESENGGKGRRTAENDFLMLKGGQDCDASRAYIYYDDTESTWRATERTMRMMKDISEASIAMIEYHSARLHEITQDTPDISDHAKTSGFYDPARRVFEVVKEGLKKVVGPAAIIVLVAVALTCMHGGGVEASEIGITSFFDISDLVVTANGEGWGGGLGGKFQH